MVGEIPRKFEVVLPKAKFRSGGNPIESIKNLFRKPPELKLILLEEPPRRRTIYTLSDRYVSVEFPRTLTVWLEPLSSWQNHSRWRRSPNIPFFFFYLDRPIPDGGCRADDLMLGKPRMPNIFGMLCDICFGNMINDIRWGQLHPHTAFWNSSFDHIPDKRAVGALSLETFLYLYLRATRFYQPRNLKFSRKENFKVVPHVDP